MSEIIKGGYNDPTAKGNTLKKYRKGKACIGFPVSAPGEPVCPNEAGTAWSPLWCFECNVKRIDSISASLEGIVSFTERTTKRT